MHTHYLPFDVSLQFVQNLECVLRDIVTENADLQSKILIKERLIDNCRQLLKMKVRTYSLAQLEVYQLNSTAVVLNDTVMSTLPRAFVRMSTPRVVNNSNCPMFSYIIAPFESFYSKCTR